MTVHLPPTMHVLERGWLSSNNIVFLGTNDSTIVDTGYATHAPQTLDLVRHLLAGRQLDRIVNTHLHSDHCGGNALLQQHYPCQIWIPEAEADKVLRWDEDALSFQAAAQVCDRFYHSHTVTHGDVLEMGQLRWHALAAPGHDPHSLMFYCEEEGILISADALWEHGFGVIFPELMGNSGFAEARATLELIATLDVRLVIPGHGAPFSDVRAALARALSRIDYFIADPVRNAQYALKVLLKFLLLERQHIALDQLGTVLAQARFFADANQHHLKLPPDQLTDWVVQQLCRSGSATIGDGMLHNAG